MSPVICAALIVLMEGMSFGLILPVLGYYCEHLGGTALMAGVLFALVSGPKVFTNPLFGGLSDRIGRRPVLVINTLGTLSGSILWAFSGNVTMLAASRAVTGVFSAQAGLAQAVVADAAPPQQRAAAMGLLGAAFGIAFGFGPMIGGWIGERFSYGAVGWVCAAMQAFSLMIILFALPETSPRATPASRETKDNGATSGMRSRSGWLAVLRSPQTTVLLAVTIMNSLGTSQLISTFTTVAKSLYQFDAARAGMAFGVIGVIGIVVQGLLIRPCVARFGERTTAFAGLLFTALGLGQIGLRGPEWMFWTACGLIGLGTALATPCLASLLSQTCGPADQGNISGLNQSALGMGRAGGNVMGGSLLQAAGIGVCYSAATALVLAAALLLVRSSARGESAVTVAQPVADG